MPELKISKRTVDAAGAANGDVYYWDPELRGFGLRVTPRGVKSYVVQYRLKGCPARRKTIGIHGSPWTPDKAREEAQRLLILAKKGVDPVDEERERSRQRLTLAFGDYADRFVKLYLKEHWRDSWQEGERILDKNVKPIWKARPVSAITRADVSELLDRFADRPAMKKNTHSVLRKLFRWAAGRGDIASSPIAEMPAPKAVPSRKRVLSREELVCAWLAADKLGHPWRGVVRLLIATLQRRQEVAALTWQELHDLAGADPMWELPPERAKNDEGHRVPLNALALREIERLEQKKKGFLFTKTGKTAVSGFSDAKERLDGFMLEIMRERAEERGEDPAEVELQPWRFHDLRRTGTTAMQALDVPIEVTEAVINHVSGTRAGVAGVYNRFKYEPQKRRALTLWSDHLERLVAGQPNGGNVVPIDSARNEAAA